MAGGYEALSGWGADAVRIGIGKLYLLNKNSNWAWRTNMQSTMDCVDSEEILYYC